MNMTDSRIIPGWNAPIRRPRTEATANQAPAEGLKPAKPKAPARPKAKRRVLRKPATQAKRATQAKPAKRSGRR